MKNTRGRTKEKRKSQRRRMMMMMMRDITPKMMMTTIKKKNITKRTMKESITKENMRKETQQAVYGTRREASKGKNREGRRIVLIGFLRGPNKEKILDLKRQEETGTLTESIGDQRTKIQIGTKEKNTTTRFPMMKGTTGKDIEKIGRILCIKNPNSLIATCGL